MAKSCLLVLICCLLLNPICAGEKVIKDEEGMDCWVYFPDEIDSGKTYWLVVGVHGLGGKGKGASGVAKWVTQEGDCIVIGPSFNDGYQMGNGKNADKLKRLFKDLKKEYKLHDRMFVHGFSAGAQFVHRFAFNEPNLIAGVSAHSAGSWATRGYGKISLRAKKIPFAISCGEKDTGKSYESAPLGRLAWFKEFRDELDKKKFDVESAVVPGVKHRQSPKARELAKNCYARAKAAFSK